MQKYTVYLYLQTAPHVSCCISTHHQELISLYLQYVALLRPLLLPVVSHPVTFTTGSSNGLSNARYCRYSVMSSWWWWKYHPKHVEQLTDINKLYIFASCWIIIAIYYMMHRPLNIKNGIIFPKYHTQASLSGSFPDLHISIRRPEPHCWGHVYLPLKTSLYFASFMNST